MERFLVAFLVGVPMFLIDGLLFKVIYNANVSEIFGTGELTFSQSIGIVVLASLLFGTQKTTEVVGNIIRGSDSKP